jgi:acid stress-induced BolA-like protein IbaG/YrbA
MGVQEKVERALRHSLGAEVVVDLEDDDGIIGVVVSSKFRRMEPMDRQTIIDKALRSAPEALTQEEMRRVIVIAPLTPEEHAAYSAR